MKKAKLIIILVVGFLIVGLLLTPLVLEKMDSIQWEKFHNEQEKRDQIMMTSFEHVEAFDTMEYENGMIKSVSLNSDSENRMKYFASTIELNRQNGPFSIYVNCLGEERYIKIDGLPIANKLNEAECLIKIDITRFGRLNKDACKWE